MQTFQVTLSPYVSNYFKKAADQDQLTQFFEQKLPLYLVQRPAKIKPVHGPINHLFELKVRVGRQFYRAAFYHVADQLSVVYVTDTLQKVKFDREATHFLEKQS